MKKALGLLFGLCLISCSTAAYPATNNIAVAGMGTSECPQFLQHVRENPGMETTYFTWAQGVLSGWNMRAMADKRDVLNLALMAPDQQQAHVREYCEKHPDSAYFVADWRYQPELLSTRVIHHKYGRSITTCALRPFLVRRHPANDADPAVLVLNVHPVTPPSWLPVFEPKDASGGVRWIMLDNLGTDDLAMRAEKLLG